MNSQEDRLYKQTLLKSEILDKGYDGNNFADFMESRREEGNSDIKKSKKKAQILTIGN